MPRGKWIDKKTAQHFTLVHRPQNDPLIHDSDAPSMVLNPTSAPNSHKARKLDDLASELGSDAARIRANEGEAASYGVYFDDTEYDYMQHLRDLNTGGGEAVFVEAKPPPGSKDKGKQKQSLEDALRQLDVGDGSASAGPRSESEQLGDDFLPSKNLRHLTYQAQQDVPDAIGGFQPDMDPRLREVLEALEDEAYVEEGGDDEDLFQQLAKDGRELDDFEFDRQAEFFDEGEEDDGWESDDTAKPSWEYKTKAAAPPSSAAAANAAEGDEAPSLVPISEDGVPNENWLEDFKQFKKDQKQGPAAGQKKAAAARAPPSNSDLQSSLFTTTTNGGQRRKKRKGALTSQSGYSMTSSSMVRTEQLGILDERFEQLEARHYNPEFDLGDDDESVLYGDGMEDDEDGTASLASGATGASRMSTASSVGGQMRHDFDDILDDFLGGYSMHGKKHMKKGGWKSGAEQLDEIRRELGPARLGRFGAHSSKAAAAAPKNPSAAPAAKKGNAAAALAFGAPAAASASR